MKTIKKHEQEYEEEIKSLKIDRIILIIGIFLIILISSYYIHIESINKDEVVCYDFKELNETINKIEENCGSTYLTHSWNDTSNWYIFKTTYENNQPNYNYYPLEDCLE